MSATAGQPGAPELTPAISAATGVLFPRSGSATVRRRPRSGAAGIDTADPGVLFLRWTELHDERAREALVKRFLPLARTLARRYARSSEPLEDLVQVASLGLLKAIDRFDPALGLAFSSYAVPTILGELRRYFRDTSWAGHVPRGAQERARKVETAGQLLAGQTGRSPAVGELARYLGVSDEEVLDGVETSQAHAAVSLDAPRATDDGLEKSYADTIGEEDHSLALVDPTVTVSTAIKQLPKREQWILHLRFVEDLTQAEIARRIGVSQMHVSRLLRRSLQRLHELTANAQPYE
jgi:RNA polymerase sigma-B factor